MPGDRPSSIGDILADLARNQKKAREVGLGDFGQRLEQGQILEQWDELVGEHLAQHGRPRGIKENRLRVEVDSAVWMHRFSFIKWDIVKRVNRKAGKELISDIFIELADKDED